MFIKCILVLVFTALAGWSESSLNPSTLDAAIRSGNQTQVEAHLRVGLGGDTITGPQFGTTALMVASVVGDSNIIALLATGATNLDAREKYQDLGETALMKALIRGSEDGALTLLAFGADARRTNAFGWNALHLAAYRGFDRGIAAMISKASGVDELTDDGYTALHLAARYGHATAVRLLVAKGAKLAQRTQQGKTACELAGLAPWPEVLTALGCQTPAIGRGPQTSGPFSVQVLLTNGRPLLMLVHTAEALGPAMQVAIEPAAGGRVVAWRVGERELLKSLNPSDGDRAGGIPILFPTPNAVTDGRLTLGGLTVLMRNPDSPRPTGMHGYGVDDVFAWESPTVISTAARATLHLVHTIGSVRWAAFPRSNSLALNYLLKSDGLRIEYEISNRDQRLLPVGFGVHPYWAIGSAANMRLTASHRQVAHFVKGRWSLTPAQGACDLRAGGTSDSFPGGTTFFYGAGAVAQLAWLDAPTMGIRMVADLSQQYMVLHKPGGSSNSSASLCVEHQGNAPDAHRLLAAGQISEAGLYLLRPGETVRGWVEYLVETKP